MRLFLISLLCLHSLSVMAEKVITIATEEYPPYTSAKLNHYGIDAHIVSRAFELEGYKVNYEFYPGARSYKLAQIGKVDATLPWAKREDREVFFLYSDPVIEVDNEHLYFKSERKLDWDPENPDYSKLKGLTIGAIISYNYGEIFQKAEESGVIETARAGNLPQLFKMILADRIDVIISKRQVAQHTLLENFSKEDINKLISVPETNKPKGQDYLLISKENPKAQEIMQAVNTGIKKLHKSGEYKSLLEAFERGEYGTPE